MIHLTFCRKKFRGITFVLFYQMNQKKHPFGSTIEAVLYPTFLLIILWIIQWMGAISTFEFYKLGLKPRTIEGLKGIFFMPLLHSQQDIQHLLNNSVALFVLLAVLVYYYRSIAFRVMVLLWLMTGTFVWLYAANRGVYHIGISGVIYGLVGFLFVSGVLRKYLPLQAISLFVVFVYGNMIWGIFPVQANISWEGHFMGLVAGLILAVIYKDQSIQQPKYQYEIEKEMGIEPPDYEKIWNDKQEELRRQLEEQQMEENQTQENPTIKITYHYKNEDDTFSKIDLGTTKSTTIPTKKKDKNDSQS